MNSNQYSSYHDDSNDSHENSYYDDDEMEGEDCYEDPPTPQTEDEYSDFQNYLKPPSFQRNLPRKAISTQKKSHKQKDIPKPKSMSRKSKKLKKAKQNVPNQQQPQSHLISPQPQLQQPNQDHSPILPKQKSTKNIRKAKRRAKNKLRRRPSLNTPYSLLPQLHTSTEFPSFLQPYFNLLTNVTHLQMQNTQLLNLSILNSINSIHSQLQRQSSNDQPPILTIPSTIPQLSSGIPSTVLP